MYIWEEEWAMLWKNALVTGKLNLSNVIYSPQYSHLSLWDHSELRSQIWEKYYSWIKTLQTNLLIFYHLDNHH